MSKEPSDLVKFKSKLHSNEEICSFAPGYVGEMLGTGKDKQVNGVLILTNQRVVFYSKSFFSEVQESISLEKVSSVETGKIALIQIVKIYTSGNTLIFKSVNPAEANSMVDKILISTRSQKKETSTSGASLSIGDELKKLVELKSAGVLTDEEFQKAKAKLVA